MCFLHCRNLGQINKVSIWPRHGFQISPFCLGHSFTEWIQDTGNKNILPMSWKVRIKYILIRNLYPAHPSVSIHLYLLNFHCLVRDFTWRNPHTAPTRLRRKGIWLHQGGKAWRSLGSPRSRAWRRQQLWQPSILGRVGVARIDWKEKTYRRSWFFPLGDLLALGESIIKSVKFLPFLPRQWFPVSSPSTRQNKHLLMGLGRISYVVEQQCLGDFTLQRSISHSRSLLWAGWPPGCLSAVLQPDNQGPPCSSPTPPRTLLDWPGWSVEHCFLWVSACKTHQFTASRTDPPHGSAQGSAASYLVPVALVEMRIIIQNWVSVTSTVPFSAPFSQGKLRGLYLLCGVFADMMTLGMLMVTLGILMVTVTVGTMMLMMVWMKVPRRQVWRLLVSLTLGTYTPLEKGSVKPDGQINEGI